MNERTDGSTHGCGGLDSLFLSSLLRSCFCGKRRSGYVRPRLMIGTMGPDDESLGALFYVMC